MSQEADYSYMFKTSTSLVIISMSFIKSKLDISFLPFNQLHRIYLTLDEC
jgi:hypothetical protein